MVYDIMIRKQEWEILFRKFEEQQIDPRVYAEELGMSVGRFQSNYFCYKYNRGIWGEEEREEMRKTTSKFAPEKWNQIMEDYHAQGCPPAESYAKKLGVKKGTFTSRVCEYRKRNGITPPSKITDDRPIIPPPQPIHQEQNPEPNDTRTTLDPTKTPVMTLSGPNEWYFEFFAFPEKDFLSAIINAKQEDL